MKIIIRDTVPKILPKGSEKTTLSFNGEAKNDIPQIKDIFLKACKFKVIGQDIVYKLFEVLDTISTYDVKDEFPQKFDKLESIVKPSIEGSDLIEENTKQELLGILDRIPRIAKREIVCGLLKTSDDFTGMTSIESPNMHAKFYEKTYKHIQIALISLLGNLDTQDLLDINDIHKENFFPTIISLFDTICHQTTKESFMRGANISQTGLEELKEKFINKYPDVGKSNLNILNNLQKLESEYIIYVKETISEIFSEFLKERKDQYKLPGDILKDMLDFFTILFASKEGFKRYYMYFLDTYMNNLLSQISQRKSKQKSNKDNDELYVKEETISSFSKETKCKKVPENINLFLDEILKDYTDIQTIKKYISRIYLNGKSVRIKDIISKFPSAETLFTHDIINQAKEIGLNFEYSETSNENQPGPCKATNKVIETSVSEDMPVQVEDKVKIAFERKIERFLKSPALLDGKGFVDLMKLAGYEIENENYVARCFKKLYHNTQMKQVFLNELKRDAFSQKKYSLTKKCYRKIEIYQKKAHRILFLKDNKTIDGIYSHDDYENRVAMFLKN